MTKPEELKGCPWNGHEVTAVKSDYSNYTIFWLLPKDELAVRGCPCEEIYGNLGEETLKELVAKWNTRKEKP